jgi:hypothetical protein
MTIEDLRGTLHEHAAVAHDSELAGRADAARRSARGIRRRQRLVVVAAAALVVPVVGAVVLTVNRLDRTAPVVEVPEPDRAVVSGYAGRTLLDSRVARGGMQVTLSADVEVPTQWTATCFGVGSEFTLHTTLDGGSAAQAPCEATQPPEPQMGYVLDGRFPPGTHTIRLWLSSNDGTATVTAPTAVLAAGVYRLPDPVAVVAGVPVYDRERVFDRSMDVMQEWQYVESQESQPGDQRLMTAHRGDSRMVGQLVAPHVSPEDVLLLVDGVEGDASSVLSGSGFVGPLPPGRHTIELRIRGGAHAAARLGVVWRELAR